MCFRFNSVFRINQFAKLKYMCEIKLLHKLFEQYNLKSRAEHKSLYNELVVISYFEKILTRFVSIIKEKNNKNLLYFIISRKNYLVIIAFKFIVIRITLDITNLILKKKIASITPKFTMSASFSTIIMENELRKEVKRNQKQYIHLKFT